VEQLCRQNIQQPATIVAIAKEFIQNAHRQKYEMHADKDALASLEVAQTLVECLKLNNAEGYAQQDPELYPGIYERKAQLLSEMGRHAESKAVYQMLRSLPCPATLTCDAAFKARQIDDIALEAMHLGQAEEGVALYKEVETLLSDPQFTEKQRYQLYNGLANGYRMLGQFDEARSYAKRAMAAYSDHPRRMSDATDSAAEIELDAKQYDAALALNEKSFTYEIGSDAIYRETMKARILRAMNRRDEACKVLTSALLRVAKAQPDEDIQKAQTLYRELACQSGTAVH
jgi:tetratricopeptide (TPR) repeat protein